MNTLIIDTSHRYLAVGLVVNGVIVASKQDELNKQQSEFLVPFVEEVLSAGNIKVTDLNRVVVTDGPGSYTGMRIGITFVKSIAMVIESLEVYKVNTLLSLSGLSDSFAFLDARSGRVFGAYCNDGVISEEKVYQVTDLETINKQFVGDVKIIDKQEVNIDVISNILAVEAAWQRVVNPDVLVPRYLK